MLKKLLLTIIALTILCATFYYIEQKSPRGIAWRAFEKYLEANKAKDLETLKTLVYKVAPVCEDPETLADCKSRMNLAYEYGVALKKKSFTNVWEDQKQLILTTDFWTEENETAFGRFRSIIFFIKTESGELKLVSFSPFKGARLSKGEASIEELTDRAIRYTEDNDMDGLADYDEECLDEKTKATCTKTDIRSRDTDQDGLWDSLEALMI